MTLSGNNVSLSFAPLPFRDGYLTIAEIDIFDSHTDTLPKPQTGAIHQVCHDSILSGKMFKDYRDFLPGKNHRQIFFLSGPDQAVKFSHIFIEDIFI